jgi:hypothetical protein
MAPATSRQALVLILGRLSQRTEEPELSGNSATFLVHPWTGLIFHEPVGKFSADRSIDDYCQRISEVANGRIKNEIQRMNIASLGEARFPSPLRHSVREKKHIDPDSIWWTSVLSATGQPARF